ncbi:unnamed protein product, partial [Musa textilis]
ITVSLSISLSHQLQWSCEKIRREEKESSSPYRLTEALDLRKIFPPFFADGIKG